MYQKEAEHYVRLLMTPKGFAETKALEYETVLPREFRKSLPDMSTILKQGIQAFTDKDYAKLPVLYKQQEQVANARRAMVDVFIAKNRPISNQEVAEFLRNMPKDKMASKSQNRAFYLDRVNKVLNKVNDKNFKQLAEGYSNAFGHDMGELLRPDWRANLAQRTTVKTQLKPKGPSWLLPALAIGAMFLI